MEAGDMALVAEANTRTASFDDLATDGEQKVFNVDPLDGARNRVLEDGCKGLFCLPLMIAIYACTLSSAIEKR